MVTPLMLLAVLQAASASGAGPPRHADSVTAFPALTGAFRVGTAVAYLTDSSRHAAAFPTGRPITVQLWYPTRQARGATAPYLLEPGLGAALLQRGYYEVDSAALRAWAARPTRSIVGAAPAPGRHPLLTFSVGLGVIRANYTSLAEELASHGYVVAQVETPYAGLMLLPDGGVVEDTIGLAGDAAGHRALIDDWAADITYALTALERGQMNGVAGRMGRSVDWSRVAASGHSSGGLLAVEVAHRDPRIRAAINLDGGVASPEKEPLAQIVTTGTTKPTLFLREQPIYTDADFARRGLTRAQWEARAAGGHDAIDEFTARSNESLWFGRVAGTGHFSFTDAPFVMPSTITRFGGKIIDGQRGLLAITSAMRLFLENYPAPSARRVAALKRRFPEVSLGRASHEASR